MTDKSPPTERPEPKPPIYSVEVINTACRALEALVAAAKEMDETTPALNAAVGCAFESAVRIIRDGLLSHEKAIRGEG